MTLKHTHCSFGIYWMGNGKYTSGTMKWQSLDWYKKDEVSTHFNHIFVLCWPKYSTSVYFRQYYDLQLVTVIGTLYAPSLSLYPSLTISLILFELWSELENMGTQKIMYYVCLAVSVDGIYLKDHLCVKILDVFRIKHTHAISMHNHTAWGNGIKQSITIN